MGKIKYIISFIVLVCLASSLLAEEKVSFRKPSDFKLGFVKGISLSNLYNLNTANKKNVNLLYSGGIFLVYKINKNLKFKAKSVYTIKEQKEIDPLDIGGYNLFHLDYMEYPLLIKYNPLKNLSIYGGASFEIPVKNYHYFKKNKSNNILKNIKKEINIGTNYFIFNNLIFDIRYNTNRILNEKKKKDNSKDNIHFSIGYMF